MVELKVVLVLSVRVVRVRGAYGEFDARGKRKGWGIWWGRRREEGRKEVEGERAYQIQLGSARASDGFPARVEMVGWDEGEREKGVEREGVEEDR